LTEINTGLGWKAGRRFTKPMAPKTCKSSISDKVDFKLTLVKWDQEGHFILIKGSTSKGNKNYQPICTQRPCAQFHQTYTKDLKAHIDPNTVVVRDFNTPLSSIDGSSKQNINKEILELNNT
jgi:hypothetical protein